MLSDLLLFKASFFKLRILNLLEDREDNQPIDNFFDPQKLNFE